jgi:chitinase
VFENVTEISSYSYDSTKKELVSYDTPDIVKLKTQYVMSKGLSGSMVGFSLTIDLIADRGYLAVLGCELLLIRNAYQALR